MAGKTIGFRYGVVQRDVGFAINDTAVQRLAHYATYSIRTIDVHILVKRKIL